MFGSVFGDFLFDVWLYLYFDVIVGFYDDVIFGFGDEFIIFGFGFVKEDEEKEINLYEIEDVIFEVGIFL